MSQVPIEKTADNIFEYAIKGAGFAGELRQAIKASNKPYYRAKYSVDGKPDRYFMLSGTTAETANDYKEITDIEECKKAEYVVVNNSYVDQFANTSQAVNATDIAKEVNNKLGNAIKDIQDTDTKIAEGQNSPQFNNFVDKCKNSELNESNFESIIQDLDTLVGEFRELSLDMAEHSDNLKINIDSLNNKVNILIDFIDSNHDGEIDLKLATTEELVDTLIQRGYEVKLKRI